MKRLISKAVVFAMVLGLGLTTAQGAVIVKKLTGLSISGSSTVICNSQTALTATASFDDGSSEVVNASWTSSSTSVATVSGSGVVTGKKGGSVTITASYTAEGITKTASKGITVNKTLQSLVISGNLGVLIKGKTTLTATAKYNDGTSGKVTPKWTSSSTAVATVSSSGVVVGKKVGSTTIKASYTYNGVTRAVSAKVTVAQKLPKSLSITGTGTSLLSDKKLVLTAMVKYTDGTTAKVKATWTTSDKTIAVVSNGTVTGKKAGSAKITATYTASGITLTTTKKITVTKQPSKLTVSGLASVQVGKKITLTATVKYNDGSSSAVKPKWKSANTALAVVSSAGVVTGKKAGKVVITATYTYAKVTVTVKKTITVKK